MKHEELTWHTEKRRIKDLVPYEKNPRILTDAQAEDLKRSIEKFNLVEIPAINTDGKIIAGHQRLKIMVLLGRGEEFTDVRVPNRPLSDEEFSEYCIRSNKNTGEWDFEGLSQFEESLLKDIGFSSGELDKIFSFKHSDLADPDHVPEVAEEEIFVKPGDVFQLNRHRLMCGDACSLDDVKKLMNGFQGDMGFTDPPYNVDYEGGTDKKLKIQGDKLSDDEFFQLLVSSFRGFKEALKNSASLYVCHGSRFQRDFENALDASGFEVRNQIIWVKNAFTFGKGRYKFQHEPIFYSHIKGESDVWYGDKRQSTLWEVAKPIANREHPTMKPVELIEIALKNSSKREDVIVDLFGGSGSTLIACENLNRVCHTIEIDPEIIAVYVNRFVFSLKNDYEKILSKTRTEIYPHEIDLRIFPVGEYIEYVAKTGNGGHQPGMLINMELVHKKNICFFTDGGNYVDKLFFIHANQFYPVAYCEKPAVCYRTYTGNIMKSDITKQGELFVKKIEKMLNVKPEIIKKIKVQRAIRAC